MPLYRKHLPTKHSVKDLSHLVTVFLLTVGDTRHFDQCITCLESQTVTFSFYVVERLAPLSHALQVMLDTCTTPYFIEVDEDMSLRPDAVELLVAQIEDTSVDCCMVCCPLLDAFLGAPIHGLKIYRHTIANQFPFTDDDNADWLHFLTMRAAGYTSAIVPLENQDLCLGVHAEFATEKDIFSRWRGLFHKHRRYLHMSWILPWPKRLLELYVSTHEIRYLWGFVGSLVGGTEPLPESREKNYRETDGLYDLLNYWLGTATPVTTPTGFSSESGSLQSDGPYPTS
jgi:hypothetical protein